MSKQESALPSPLPHRSDAPDIQLSAEAKAAAENARLRFLAQQLPTNLIGNGATALGIAAAMLVVGAAASVLPWLALLGLVMVSRYLITRRVISAMDRPGVSLARLEHSLTVGAFLTGLTMAGLISASRMGARGELDVVLTMVACYLSVASIIGSSGSAIGTVAYAMPLIVTLAYHLFGMGGPAAMIGVTATVAYMGFIAVGAARGERAMRRNLELTHEHVRIAGRLAAEFDRAEAARAEISMTEQRYRLLAEKAPIGVAHIDENGSVVYRNEALGRALGGLECIDDPDALGTWLLASAAECSVLDEVCVQKSFVAEGPAHRRAVSITLAPVREAGRELFGYVATVADITSMTCDLEEARKAARLDALTGLVNRAGFDEALSRKLSSRADERLPVTLLVIDLDHFKQANDTYGHAAGDQVLRLVARALRGCCRASEVIARLGGDEFAILVSGPEDTQTFGCDIAKRIIESLAKPFEVAGAEISVGASIGIATLEATPQGVLPGSSDAAADRQQNAAALAAAADAALYEVKRNGRNGFRVAATAPGGARSSEQAQSEKQANHECQTHCQPDPSL